MRLGIVGYSKLNPITLSLLIPNLIREVSVERIPTTIIHSGICRPVGDAVYAYIRHIRSHYKIHCISPHYTSIPSASVVLANNQLLAASCDALLVITNGFSKLDEDLIRQALLRRKTVWKVVLNYDETIYSPEEIQRMATIREVSHA
ncbi:hypothetical protein UFOVP448_44 [uncultured Caudovirales phage]|uniref:Uncharacterized protein n=1 Tax=uncultured Caudovirales phage TaxID=2100421 RepID=A0A6J5M843_9CAUD|nr:hypothetical protein UFOVP448_44 [uncultured Caudovirales phage]